MAVESTEGGIIVTGEHINLFAARACLGALSIEINTTMRMSRGGSAFDAANSWLLKANRPFVPGKATAANKLKAYKALRALLTESGMDVNDQRTMGDKLK